VDRMADIARWVTLVGSVVSISQGVLILARRKLPVGRSKRGRNLQWRPWGLMQVWMGTAILVGVAPQVIGMTAGWAFLIAIVALLPLGIGVRFGLRANARPDSLSPPSAPRVTSP
jgi:hypothetical protein